MLTGDNGILTRAGQAKDATRGGEVQETVTLAAANNTGVDYIGGTKQTRAEVIAQLHADGKLTDSEVATLEENDVITIGGITIDFSVLGSISGELTLGEAYDQSEESWIGKTINYTSVNNSSAIEEAGGWIILGKQTNEQGKNDILITTANPVSSQSIDYTLTEWGGYETKINNACKTYIGQTGSLGSKAATIKDVRSITLEDINNAVGLTIPETFGDVNPNFYYPKEVNGTWDWVKSDSPDYKNDWYYYNENDGKLYYNSATKEVYEITSTKATNMYYILADSTEYWVASRSVDVNSAYADFYVARVGDGSVSSYRDNLCYSDASGGDDFEGSNSLAFRPVVILSSEIPFADATIGDYYEYTEGGSGSY